VHTSNEQCVSGEHCSLVTIFKEVADAVLCMAWRMKCADFDTANSECRVVGRSFGHIKTLCPANDWEGEMLELIVACQLYKHRDNSGTIFRIYTISGLPPAWSR